MPTPAAESPVPADFETALRELEALVASMEAGQLSLEQSLAAYRRGAELMQYCQKTLNEAQTQVRILTEANKLEDFDCDDSAY